MWPGILVCASVLLAAGTGRAATDAADSLASAARSLRQAGNLVEAVSATERRIAELTEVGATPAHDDDVDQSLADAHRDLSTLRTLLSLPDEQRDRILQADALSRTLVMEVARGDYAAARDVVTRQLATKREILGEDHHEVAVLFNSLAALHHAQGSFGEAEHLLREAVLRNRRALGPEHTTVLTTMQNLASVLRDRGEAEESERLYREVLSILERRRRSRPLELATTLGSLAELLHDDGAREEAKSLLRRALTTYRELVGDRHERMGETLLRLGRIQVEEGNLADAQASLAEGLEILRATLGSAHPHTGEATLHLAELRLRQGDHTAAEVLAEQALGTIGAGRGRLHPDVVAASIVTARAVWARGDLGAAGSRFAQACEIYETARLRAGSGLVRSTFFDSPHAEHAALRLEQGEESLAWEAMARHHGRGLVDLLRQSAAAHSSPLEAARVDSLRKVIAGLERRLARADSASRDDLRDRLLTAESAWSSLQRSIATRNPLVAWSPKLAQLQATLDETWALAGWLDVRPPGLEPVHWAFVIRSTGRVRWVRLDVQAEPGLAADVRLALATAADWPVRIGADAGLDRRLSRLWQQRVAPLLPALAGIEHLVIVPSGDMLGLPVECLLDEEGTSLADRWMVSYTPSPSFLVWMHERGARRALPRRASALMVADPPFGGGDTAASSLRGLPRLSRSRHEALAVAAAFDDATVLIGVDASEQALWRLANQDRLQRFDVLHVATHAVVDDRRPQRSALVLSQRNLPDPVDAVLRGEPAFDGIVTAGEIAREWRLNADLVTLSACRSGVGRRTVGEGFLGLTYAFLQVGARSLLSSLWAMDDAAASELMSRFYQNLTGDFAEDRGRGAGAALSASRALAEARIWLRERRDAEGRRPFAHPVYWAGFVLVSGAP